MLYSKELRNVYLDEINSIVAHLSDLLDSCEKQPILTSKEFIAMCDSYSVLKNLASDLSNDTFIDNDDIVC